MLAQAATFDWLHIVQSLGIPAAILIFLGWVGWKAGRWIGAEVVIPARDKLLSRFFAFLDKIEQTVAKLDVNVDAVTSNLEQQTVSLRAIREGHDRVAVQLEERHDSLDEVIRAAVIAGTTRHEAVMGELKEVKAQLLLILAKLEQIEVIR